MVRNPFATPISPARLPLVLDNTVVSTLHRANALRRVLELWPGRWFVSVQVREAAAVWPIEGKNVTSILADLVERRILEIITLDPRIEGRLFATLNRTLGQGESATIALAYYRQYGAGLDDNAARQACNRLVPPVMWTGTENLLRCAVTEHLLTLDEARAIWAATGVLDPRRQVL